MYNIVEKYPFREAIRDNSSRTNIKRDPEESTINYASVAWPSLFFISTRRGGESSGNMYIRHHPKPVFLYVYIYMFTSLFTYNILYVYIRIYPDPVVSHDGLRTVDVSNTYIIAHRIPDHARAGYYRHKSMFNHVMFTFAHDRKSFFFLVFVVARTYIRKIARWRLRVVCLLNY